MVLRYQSTVTSPLSLRERAGVREFGRVGTAHQRHDFPSEMTVVVLSNENHSAHPAN